MKSNGNKVLVCITPQSNSKRLIAAGYALANEVKGELHILHIEKGNAIFGTDDASQLLQELFHYAKEMGGVVHGLCGFDVPQIITDFIKSERITNVVLGEPPEDTPVKSMEVYTRIQETMPYLQITIINRL